MQILQPYTSQNTQTFAGIVQNSYFENLEKFPGAHSRWSTKLVKIETFISIIS